MKDVPTSQCFYILSRFYTIKTNRASICTIFCSCWHRWSTSFRSLTFLLFLTSLSHRQIFESRIELWAFLLLRLLLLFIFKRLDWTYHIFNLLWWRQRLTIFIELFFFFVIFKLVCTFFLCLVNSVLHLSHKLLEVHASRLLIEKHLTVLTGLLLELSLWVLLHLRTEWNINSLHGL
jgi:hypothetical protein